MTTVPSVPAAPANVLQATSKLPPREPTAPAPEAQPVQQAPAPAPARPAPVEEAARPTREAVDHAARRIEDFVRSVGRSLDFSVDNSTGRSVLRVVNPENGEVIRQLPPEETLRIARAVEYMQSVLVDQRA